MGTRFLLSLRFTSRYYFRLQPTPNQDKREMKFGSFIVPSPNLRIVLNFYQLSLQPKTIGEPSEDNISLRRD